MIKKLFTALVSAVALPIIVPTAAHAAGGSLAVRMKLTFSSHDCSLGFFATDSVGDQLAITAGHCANGLHEKVYNTWGQQIGEVVAWQPDAEDSHGKLTGSRGFTVVYTYKTFAIEAFFTGMGTAKVGDRVRLYGERTAGTNATITDVSFTAGTRIWTCSPPTLRSSPATRAVLCIRRAQLWSVLHPALVTRLVGVPATLRPSPSVRVSRKSRLSGATGRASRSTRTADRL